MMRLNTAHLAALAILLSAAASRAQTVTTWTPGWTQGRYWIVRTPILVPVLDPATSEVRERKTSGDFYYARFEVTKVSRWPYGGGRVEIAIKWSDSTAAIADALDTITLELDLANLNVCRARLTGLDGVGAPLDVDYKYEANIRGAKPFCWPFEAIGVSLPSEFVPVIPLFESTTTPGTYVIVDRNETDPPEYLQGVTTKPDGVISIQEDGFVCPLGSDRLEIRPGMPWFDRRAAGGTLSVEVVKVGGG